MPEATNGAVPVRTILVIEDKPIMRAMLVDLLDSEGFRVLEAENGEAGLPVARSQLPDLILSDIQMPVMDGHEVLVKLRREKRTATTPFIFLTGKMERGCQRKGMDLGADDFISKPFSSSELLDAIQARFERQAKHAAKNEAHLEELRRDISLMFPHEFNTPLTGVLAITDLPINSDGEDPQSRLEMLEYVYSSGMRLKRLADKFSLYTKLQIDRGHMGEGAFTLATHDIAVVGRKAVLNTGMRMGRSADRPIFEWTCSIMEFRWPSD
ncbi:response regulator [Rhodothermus sp. AH-315-K08]|nr:response regulator [Rhodothermus sp. AH-315-K08]